jgi:hypothetical protein
MATKAATRPMRIEAPQRTTETHLVWASQPSPDFASVTPIQGATWGARFRMPDAPACAPTSTRPLPDNLHGAGLPLVSLRVRDWLVGLGVSRDFVPVTVTPSTTYFAVLDRGSVNCINWKQADVTWHGKPHGSCAVAARRIALLKGNVTRGAWITPHGFPTILLAPREALATLPDFSGLAFVRPSLFRFAVPARAAPVSAALERRVTTRITAVAKELARTTQIEGAPAKAALERLANDTWYQHGIPTLEEVDLASDPEALALAHARGEAVFAAAFVEALAARRKRRPAARAARTR